MEEITICAVSQYSFSQVGTSACTPISLFLVAIFLRHLDGHELMDKEAIMTDAVLSGISSYSSVFGTAEASGPQHLAVEDVVDRITELACLKKVGAPIQGQLSNIDAFRQLFTESRRAANACKYAGVVITKPPETLCVFLPPLDSSSARYFLFDSHSRPQYGLDGSYMVESDSIEAIIDRLNLIFPQLPSEGEGESYSTMMYNMFEGSIFTLASVEESASSSFTAISASREQSPDEDYVLVDAPAVAASEGLSGNIP